MPISLLCILQKTYLGNRPYEGSGPSLDSNRSNQAVVPGVNDVCFRNTSLLLINTES